MPGQRCSVKVCGNTSTSIIFNGKISFHRFPQHVGLRKAWIDFCGNPKGWTPTNSSRVCSEHFQSRCFPSNLQDKLLHTKSNRRLAPEAIPSITRRSMDLYTSELQESTPIPSPDHQYTLAPVNELNSSNTAEEVVSRNSVHQFELMAEIERLEKQSKDEQKLIEELKKYNNNLVSQLSEANMKNAHLETEIQNFNKQHSDCILKKDFFNRVKELLSGTLSEAQLDLALDLKSKVIWRKDDISKALTLRRFSKKAYLFLQEENYPLPSLRTLQMYCRKIDT